MEPGQARRLQAAALGRLRRSFTAERQRQAPQTHVARTVLGELRATGELGLNPVGILTIFCWSERRDLNSAPPVPQTGALTGLRYAPPTNAFELWGFLPLPRAAKNLNRG